MRLSHRYRKSKIDCLRFVMCLLLAPVFQGFFFLWWPLTVLMKQTRQVVHAFVQSILLRCLWDFCNIQLSYLSVFGTFWLGLVTAEKHSSIDVYFHLFRWIPISLWFKPVEAQTEKEGRRKVNLKLSYFLIQTFTSFSGL